MKTENIIQEILKAATQIKIADLLDNVKRSWVISKTKSHNEVEQIEEFKKLIKNFVDRIINEKDNILKKKLEQAILQISENKYKIQIPVGDLSKWDIVINK